MAIDLENRVIHRFIRNVSAYEVGGEFYAQIIPLDTQAYAIYPNKEDNYLFYVIGDGEHTYSELRAGLGNGEAYREYPVLTNENLNVIVGGIEEEERARKEADLVLENKINEEKSARESEDSLLNESINIIQNNLAQETIDRIEAISNLNSDLQEEKQARISVDNELRSLLNSEIEERKQFDDLLDDALGEEISIRSAADELLNQRIIEESESRQSSDRTLEQLISAEETRATQAETALENAKQDVLTAGTGISIENNIISNTQPQTVIEDNLTSYSTTSALSANMGRVLQDEVENVKARGRYLSLWDCATGLAETNPPESPYIYKPGDYFIVGNVAESGSINYKPSGSSYITGEPSSTVEELEVNEDDTYIFDGSNWHIQETSRKTVTFANIAGSPSDNVALNAEFGSKQDVLVNQENIKSINGSSLLGSGNLEIASHLEYPSSWPTSSSTTTKQFCDAVAEDDTAIEGKTYLGEVRWNDLPGLVNGEVEVEIMTGTTASSKVIVLTLTSGNQAPYMWKYTYWNGGHNVSGWKGFVPTTEVANRIYGTDLNGNQTTYDKDIFGKIDDVRIDGVSVVSNKIANLGTMASEDSSNYTTTSDLNTLLEAKANVSDLGTMSAENASDYYTSEETNTAITTATNDMATQTWVGEQLGNYTTTLDLQAGYVAKESGKGLSTNDYSNSDKEKVDSLGTMSTESASDYSTKAVADTLYADKSLEQTVETHISNTDIHVTAADKSNWNAKQEALTAGTNIQIQNGVISATDTTYTAGTGIDITNGVISNTQTSAEWGNITGTLSDQTDLQSALNDKQDAISDLSDIRSGASAGATALQPNDNLSELINDVGYITGISSSDVTTALGYTPVDPSNLATVATTGDYDDLSNKPTIPVVNDATLTITQGGISKGTFTANASSDVTIDLDASVDIDNTTITKNGSDQLQAFAVMNVRTGTDVLPIWQGTEQQWTNGVGTDWYNWRTNAVYTRNFSVVGTPTIVDSPQFGCKDFSRSSYLTIQDPGFGSSDSWEFRIHLGLYGWGTLIYSPYKILVERNRGDNQAHIWLSSNGTSWDICSNYAVGSTQLGNDVTIKIGFDGTQYYIKSLDDTNTYVYYNSSTKIVSNNNLIQIGAGNNDYWSAYLYFNPSYAYSIIDNNIIPSFYGQTVLQVYTLDTTPTTSSTVYSAPNTSSALTITSVGTGTITLSDNNTYTYTQSGDETTYQTIGEAHPTWLCNINGVGVKVGNTLIADYTTLDNTPTQSSTNSITSGAVYDSLLEKLDKVSTVNVVYGTDAQGDQTTYQVSSFGAVDDVQVNGVSVVSNKIANFTVDNAPTQSSTNLITSGGVYSAIPSIIMRDWSSNNNSNL